MARARALRPGEKTRGARGCRLIRAILYDLDGVLVDACEWHYLALNKALQSVAGTLISRVEHETVFNGLPTKRKLDVLIQQGRVREKDWKAIWELKQQLT